MQVPCCSQEAEGEAVKDKGGEVQSKLTGQELGQLCSASPGAHCTCLPVGCPGGCVPWLSCPEPVRCGCSEIREHEVWCCCSPGCQVTVCWWHFSRQQPLSLQAQVWACVPTVISLGELSCSLLISLPTSLQTLVPLLNVSPISQSECAVASGGFLAGSHGGMATDAF